VDNYPEKLVELRRIRGLTQQALGKLIGVTAQAIANYEAGMRPPDSLMCMKLALISPTSELRVYFSQLSGDRGVEVAIGRVVLGESGVHESNPWQTDVEWTREDLENDPTYKWVWASRFRGKTVQEQEAGARSMGISLKTLHKWIEIALSQGPEGFVSAKKKRRVYQAIGPETPDEAKLVSRLLTVLRSPDARTKALKTLINESFESLTSRKD